MSPSFTPGRGPLVPLPSLSTPPISPNPSTSSSVASKQKTITSVAQQSMRKEPLSTDEKFAFLSKDFKILKEIVTDLERKAAFWTDKKAKAGCLSLFPLISRICLATILPQLRAYKSELEHPDYVEWNRQDKVVNELTRCATLFNRNN